MLKVILNFIIIFLCAFSLSKAQDIENQAIAFGTLPEISNVLISPDGSKLLMLQNVDGKIFVVTRSLEDLSSPLIGIPYDDGSFNWALWLSNDRILVSARNTEKSKGGTFLRTKNYMIAMDWKGENRKVWYFPSLLDILEDEPDNILVKGFTKKRRWNDETVKLNLLTDEKVHHSDGGTYLSNPKLDKDHHIRYGTKREGGYSIMDDNIIALYRKSINDDWIELSEYKITFGLGKKRKKAKERPFNFEGFSDDPSIIYISKKDDNGKNALFTYNVDSKATIEKIVSHDRYDLTSFTFDKDYKLEKYYYFDERPQIVRVGDDGEKLSKIFKKAFPDTSILIQSQSKDRKKIIIKVTSPQEPGSFYLFDVETKKISMLSYNYRKVDIEKLATMKPVTYKARDGLEIPGYLSLPKGGENKSLPTIIMPHGGPLARDNWGFRYRVQFLTSQGYAVLQMNYRGSTGYGEDFVKKGFHEWGRKMLEDINDGAKWMISQGYADPERICIMGGSYGGYAALQANVKDQTLYKCSIATAPVSNMRKQFSRLRTNYIESKDWTYKEASPSDNMDKINEPILLFHGDMDQTVDIKTTRRFYKKMLRKGKDIKYTEFKGGDHYLSVQEHRITFLKETGIFLEKHLKGAIIERHR